MHSTWLISIMISITNSPFILAAPVSPSSVYVEGRDIYSGKFSESPPEAADASIDRRAPNPSVAPLPVPGINAGLGYQPEPDTSGMTGSQADKALQDYSHQQQSTPAGKAAEAVRLSNDRMGGSIAHDDTHKRETPNNIEQRSPDPSVAPLPVPGINAGLGYQPEPDTSGMTGSQADKALQDYSHQQQNTPAGKAAEAGRLSNDRMGGSIAHDDTHKRAIAPDSRNENLGARIPQEPDHQLLGPFGPEIAGGRVDGGRGKGVWLHDSD